MGFSGDARLRSRCCTVSGISSWKPMRIGFILLLKVWKTAMDIFLPQFLSLVKNVERRPLGEEGKKWKMEFFFLLPKNIDGIGDIQWGYVNYTLSLLLSFLQHFK